MWPSFRTKNALCNSFFTQHDSDYNSDSDSDSLRPFLNDFKTHSSLIHASILFPSIGMYSGENGVGIGLCEKAISNTFSQPGY